MAHFYGEVQGNRGKTTRCGSKNSGCVSKVASWEGAVQVHLWYNHGKEADWASVSLVTHNGAGKNILLYDGPVSGKDFEQYQKK